MIDMLFRSADPAAGLKPDANSAQARALLTHILTSPLEVSRKRHSRRIVPAAASLAAVAAAAIAIPVLWVGGAGSAYAVTPQGGGAITIEASWHRLHGLGELQHAIDAAGARTRVYVTGHAPMRSLPACTEISPSDEEFKAAPHVPRDAFDAPGTDNAHLRLTVRPELLPPGATVVATFDYSQQNDHDASSSFFVIFSPPPNNCAPLGQWFAPTP